MAIISRLPVPAPVRRAAPAPTLGQVIAARGYQPNYRDGMDCPGCGFGAFYLGRHSAECARCGTALPFAPAGGAR
ncbi:MAG: hypothetical protein K2W86_14880 [Sphingomonas sp.]|uniref:hypothetical protein n=1 Tax=Sphingomonas sp. TaxID=28214 RepID=UPI0035A89A17|nr:hypothetical protein [Sphingomonas sp.]